MISGATVEKLDRIYFCTECKTVFLFRAEVEDHEMATGHAKMNEMSFDW